MALIQSCSAMLAVGSLYKHSSIAGAYNLQTSVADSFHRGILAQGLLDKTKEYEREARGKMSISFRLILRRFSCNSCDAPTIYFLN